MRNILLSAFELRCQLTNSCLDSKFCCGTIPQSRDKDAKSFS
jgi:hypothetical protein